LPGQGGVLDRPTLDKPTPGRESEFDIKYVTFITPNLTMRETCFTMHILWPQLQP
jgi:hypothetical protein